MNIAPHPDVIRPEQRAYEAALPSVVEEHEGKYVVIKGSALVRYFDAYEDATRWAYGEFGTEPFFVKLVSADHHVAHFTRDI